MVMKFSSALHHLMSSQLGHRAVIHCSSNWPNAVAYSLTRSLDTSDIVKTQDYP